MRSLILTLLFSFLFCLPITTVYAQLPLLETSWQGTTTTPNSPVSQLRFRHDTLLVTSVSTTTLATVMRYDQAGDTLVCQQVSGSGMCGEAPFGAYRLIYFNNGETLRLQVFRDACVQRQKLLSGITFTRIHTNPDQPPYNWPYLDPQQDSIAGISLYRAYELLKNRPSVPVTVGVLDSGIDIAHEDLRDVIWTNPKEQPDNHTDDDKNGYVDDVNGWNFMGAKDGTTNEYDQPEITRTYVLLQSKYDQANPATLTPSEKRQYDTYQRAKKQFLPRYVDNHIKYVALTDTTQFWRIANQIRQKLPDTTTSAVAIRSVELDVDSLATTVRSLLADAYRPQYGSFRAYLNLVRKNWARSRQIMSAEAVIAYNPDYNPREAVGDNPADPTQRYYGSPRMIIDHSGQLALHGSHVAGIIGAKRANGRGIDGVADNVRIMPVSVVPANGDERDKDVANGIRYAVANGAKVINMSFGKRLSPFKEQVDAAIRFAEEHDVLIVHAAGNNGENYDSLPAYPSARYENGRVAQNVLVVGNSAWRIGIDLPNRSSNYGPQTVDLFAPGTLILSTLPHNRYASFSGTSMAAPMTAGVAALLRSYFPRLTAVQVKTILMKSTYQPDVLVRKPGRSPQQVPFRSLSRSGGLLNAYAAVKMAMEM